MEALVQENQSTTTTGGGIDYGTIGSGTKRLLRLDGRNDERHQRSNERPWRSIGQQ